MFHPTPNAAPEATVFGEKRVFQRDGESFQGVFEAGAQKVDEQALAAYLRFGYVPGSRTLLKGVDYVPVGAGVAPVAPYPHRDFGTATGLELLRKAVAKLHLGDKHIVPLSGGFDSRLILALLAEIREPKKIQTLTYGLPGTLDFELGNRVASALGTDHTVVELTNREITLDRLHEAARISDGNTDIFQPVVWTHIREKIDPDAVIWSGFTGDGIAGSHGYPREDVRATEALLDFAVHASHTIRFYRSYENVWEAAQLCGNSGRYDEVLDLREAVFFENHVERYTAHHIFMRGTRYALPFMDESVMSYFLSLPHEHRDGKPLFNQLCFDTFPKLFDIPTTCASDLFRERRGQLRHLPHVIGDFGKRAAARFTKKVTHPGRTYWNYDDELARESDLRRLTRGLHDSVVKRGLVDEAHIEMLWKRHRAQPGSGYTLTLLGSLEIILREAGVS